MARQFIEKPLDLDDRDLVDAVFHHVLHIVGDAFKDQTKEREILRALSPGLRMIYFTEELDLQVKNGGFDQYFWNQCNRNALDALAGFELIEAHRFALIAMGAITQFVTAEPELSRYYDEGTLQAFSDSCKEMKFADVDEAYFDADGEKSVDALRAAFIRNHADQFHIDRLEKCCFSVFGCPLMRSTPESST